MSSLKDLASLIMVPSLVKDGRLDTVKPLGNSIIHPDATGNNDGTDGSTPAEGNFTFSRGSNLAATRVDVNGLIEKGRENLFTYSNTFSNSSWLKADTSVTGGQSGYDGSNDAWLLEITGGTGFQTIRKQPISFSEVNTFSFYAKAGTLSWVRVNTGVAQTYFDIGNGVVSSFDSSIGASIEAVGNGYYRCIVPVEGSSSVFFIYPASGSGNVSQSSGNLYIQDAQWEKSLVATDYIETGASTAQAGILEDLPRLDYSGGASCPALLLEPQRSNLITQSEYFESSSWAKTAAGLGTIPVLTSNYGISPEGLMNASRLQMNLNGGTSGGDISYISFFDGFSTATNSVYLKSLGSDTTLTFRCGSTFESIVVTSEWQRFQSTDANGTDRFQLLLYGNSDSQSADVLIWGAQLEEGSYPTSYIPTMGSAVTRSKEGANLTGLSNVFGSSASTTFVEIDIPPSGSLSPTGVWTLTAAADTSNFISMCQFDSGITTPRVALYIGGVAIIDQYLSTPLSEGAHKVCFVYQDGSQKLFIDGVEELSLTESFNYVEFTKLSINDAAWALGNNGGPYSNKQTLVFPTALTDSECIALTTI
jgi:hypothetical protein